jgi:hypothetical protein
MYKIKKNNLIFLINNNNPSYFIVIMIKKFFFYRLDHDWYFLGGKFQKLEIILSFSTT